jgi:DNA-binding GntR family transcriptional regulator
MISLPQENTPGVELPSRTDSLSALLRERILRGIYRPGENIRERRLQEELGVSNATVRAAIQRLVSDGILIRVPRLGAQVIGLTEPRLVEVFQTRIALLETAVDLAVHRASDEAMEEAAAVRESLDAALAEINDGRFSIMNGQLMGWVFRASGNQFLHQVWDKSQQLARVYAYESMRQTRARQSGPLQHRLMDVIVNRDTDRAREAARTLTTQVLRDLKIDA